MTVKFLEILTHLLIIPLSTLNPTWDIEIYMTKGDMQLILMWLQQQSDTIVKSISPYQYPIPSQAFS